MRSEILLVCALVTLTSSCTDQPSCFVNRIFNFNFPREGFYQITIQNNPTNFSVKAYGDFNDDLWSDFVADLGDGNFAIFMWDKTVHFFIQLPVMNVSSGCTPESFYLYDINKDGLLDLTVWGALPNGNHCLVPFIQKDNESKSLAISFMELPGTQLLSALQPIYFAHRKSEITGFIGYSSTRIVLQYLMSNKQYISTEWAEIFSSVGIYSTVPFSQPHFNSFLDITGDCHPDVIITNEKGEVEFWINEGLLFKLNGTLKYSNLASISFTDINYDGGVDLVYAQQSGKLSFFYNQYPARSSDDFCCKDCQLFPYNLSNPRQFSFGDNFTLPQQVLHFGDVNIDGYPDILVVLLNKGTSKTLPYIYLNTASQYTDFKSQSEYNDIFSSVLSNSTIQSASFFDILENGIIDSFICVKNPDKSYSMITFYNNYLYQNNFYLKGYGAIGPTTERGSYLTGAIFYWINSMDGSMKVTIQSQSIQTAYTALQLPYVLNGLGRANNYVESFTIANEGIKNSWSPIIPNSQLAVYTMPTSPSDWAITIYVLPTESLIYVIIVSMVILLILGSVLSYVKFQNYKNRPRSDQLIG